MAIMKDYLINQDDGAQDWILSLTEVIQEEEKEAIVEEDVGAYDAISSSIVAPCQKMKEIGYHFNKWPRMSHHRVRQASKSALRDFSKEGRNINKDTVPSGNCCLKCYFDMRTCKHWQ